MQYLVQAVRTEQSPACSRPQPCPRHPITVAQIPTFYVEAASPEEASLKAQHIVGVHLPGVREAEFSIVEADDGP